MANTRGVKKGLKIAMVTVHIIRSVVMCALLEFGPGHVPDPLEVGIVDHLIIVVQWGAVVLLKQSPEVLEESYYVMYF